MQESRSSNVLEGCIIVILIIKVITFTCQLTKLPTLTIHNTLFTFQRIQISTQLRVKIKDILGGIIKEVLLESLINKQF